MSPNGKTLYVSNYTGNSVVPVTLATGTVGTPIAVGRNPDALAITPNGQTLYAANFGAASVTPIATATNTPGPPITVGGQPFGLAMSPSGQTLYATSYGAQNVTPIAVATNTAGTPIAAGSRPFGVAVTPDGQTAYVTNYQSNVVTPFATATGTVGNPIYAENNPRGIVVAPDQAPVAAFTATPGVAGRATRFDASSSTAPGAAIVRYHWSFGDGTSSSRTTPTVSHVYATSGTYPVTLTLTDADGTSTKRVFTGQTMSLNGGPSARTTHPVQISRGCPGGRRLGACLT